MVESGEVIADQHSGSSPTNNPSSEAQSCRGHCNLAWLYLSTLAEKLGTRGASVALPGPYISKLGKLGIGGSRWPYPSILEEKHGGGGASVVSQGPAQKTKLLK